MQFGAKTIHFKAVLVFILPGVHCSESVYACGHFFLARHEQGGEAFSTGVLPRGAPAGGWFPLSKPSSLVEGKRSQQDVLGCSTGVYVNVWLISAGNCKIFPVEGAGSWPFVCI